MKKVLVFLLMMCLFVLSGCDNESIIARDYLYGYLEDEDFEVDIATIDVYDYQDQRFGGFSNYGFADDEHLELMYLKDSVLAEVCYSFTYHRVSVDSINLVIDQVKITYTNIETNEYIHIVKDNLNDSYAFTQIEYDEFLVALYELRLQDVVWVLDHLGYEVM